MYCEYGYTRKSTPKQSIDRQIRNIKALYPKAIIIQETYTGTKIDRKEWNKLYRVVKEGDTIIFDFRYRPKRPLLQARNMQTASSPTQTKDENIWCRRLYAPIREYTPFRPWNELP